MQPRRVDTSRDGTYHAMASAGNIQWPNNSTAPLCTTLTSRLAGSVERVDAPIAVWCRDHLLTPARLDGQTAALDAAMAGGRVEDVVAEVATGIVKTREFLGLTQGGLG